MNYKRIHDQIIQKAKNSNRVKGDGNYYEAHHIIPQCMGGEGKVFEWKTHPNIVLLTAKEHFVIHKLLCEIYPNNNKLFQAYWRFVNGNQNRNHKGKNYYNIGSREYERLRIQHCELSSKMNSGEKNPNFGRTGQKHPMFGKGDKRRGGNNPAAKKVICIITGKIYGCVKDAAEGIGVKRGTLTNWLLGNNPNKSSLRYL